MNELTNEVAERERATEERERERERDLVDDTKDLRKIRYEI